MEIILIIYAILVIIFVSIVIGITLHLYFESRQKFKQNNMTSEEELHKLILGLCDKPEEWKERDDSCYVLYHPSGIRVDLDSSYQVRLVTLNSKSLWAHKIYDLITQKLQPTIKVVKEKCARLVRERTEKRIEEDLDLLKTVLAPNGN